MSIESSSKKDIKIDISNVESFFICHHCHKAFVTKNILFFEHSLNCENKEHVDSPITTRWYTNEELIEKYNDDHLIKNTIVINTTYKKRPYTR